MLAKKENSELSELFNTVVKGGYCIGCGACASLEGSPIEIKFDEYKQLKATLKTDGDATHSAPYLAICPFSGKSLNEDELGETLFTESVKKDEKLGYYVNNYAGSVIEGEFRERGSSGGMGTWILTEVFNQRLVDHIIHIHQRDPDESDSRLFAYSVSTTLEEIRAGAKSRYYPIELSEVLQFIKSVPGNYAIVGIPCFLKSIRLLANVDALLKSRIKFCIGLVCGHLKSGSFAEMFAWQSGIHPKQLTSIDFRTKLDGFGSNRYGVTVKGQIDQVQVTKISRPVNELYGTDWGLGYFKYKACDYCDDVVAETADLTVGDAWLPEYINDTLGTNVIIVRNIELDRILQLAHKEGRLLLDQLSSSKVIKSQSSGFNHRREGLAYRLHLTDREGLWRPIKRVQAEGKGWTKRFRNIQKTRIDLAKTSHTAFVHAIEANSFAVFEKELEPLYLKYRKIYKPAFWIRIVNKIKWTISNIRQSKN